MPLRGSRTPMYIGSSTAEHDPGRGTNRTRARIERNIVCSMVISKDGKKSTCMSKSMSLPFNILCCHSYTRYLLLPNIQKGVMAREEWHDGTQSSLPQAQNKDSGE